MSIVYKSAIPNQCCGSGGCHVTAPIVTTTPDGKRPDIQAQTSETKTETKTYSYTGTTASYVVKAGLSYQEYLQAIDVLAQIAAGGTSVMDIDHSHLIVAASAVDQQNVLTTTDVKVAGVSGAIIPVADIEKSLRPPGASTTTPEGMVPVGGTTGVGSTAQLPRTDPTRIEDLAPLLGNNTVQVGPSSYVQKLSTNPDATDQINKFSNLTDPTDGKRRMDTAVVSNDTTLFIDSTGGTTASRTLTSPPK